MAGSVSQMMSSGISVSASAPCFPLRWPHCWEPVSPSWQDGLRCGRSTSYQLRNPMGKRAPLLSSHTFPAKVERVFWPVLGHMPSFTQPLWPWWFSILIGRPESHDHSWTHWISSAFLEARGFSSAQHRSHNPIPWPGWFQCLVGQAWVMWSPLAL